MKRYSFTFVLGFLMLVFHPTALRGQSPGRFKISGTLTATDIGSWRSIHKGVEQRKIAFLRSDPNYTLELKLLRFDPKIIGARILSSGDFQAKGATANVKTPTTPASPVVYVQSTGEGFERREVKVASAPGAGPDRGGPPGRAGRDGRRRRRDPARDAGGRRRRRSARPLSGERRSHAPASDRRFTLRAARRRAALRRPARGRRVVVPGLPVDVFPDLSAPTVTVLTEATGWAPEEVELFVTLPIESAVNGASGVRRVRSVSAAGIVGRLGRVRVGRGRLPRPPGGGRADRHASSLPEGIDAPQLGPISSIMGEITFLALTAEPGTVDARELRRLSEVVVRRQPSRRPGHLAGGADRRRGARGAGRGRPGRARGARRRARRGARQALAGGFGSAGGRLPRRLRPGVPGARSRPGRARTRTFAGAVVRTTPSGPLTVGDLADRRRRRRAEARHRGLPGAAGRGALGAEAARAPRRSTLTRARRPRARRSSQRALPGGRHDRARELPPGRLHRGRGRQRHQGAARRRGAGRPRPVPLPRRLRARPLISALALPISLVAGVLAFSAFGASINTMTLGGLTIAIGALVDDAIIDVENVRAPPARGTRETAQERAAGPLEVIFRRLARGARLDRVRDRDRAARLPAALLPAGRRRPAAAAARARLPRRALRVARRRRSR